MKMVYTVPTEIATQCGSATVVKMLDATHFVAAFKGVSPDYNGYAVVGVISGKTITSYGVRTYFAIKASNIDIAVLDSTHFAVSYSNGNNNNKGEVRVGSVSGTTITFGTLAQFETNGVTGTSIDALDSSHFVIAYEYYDGAFINKKGIAICGSVSGTTITLGTKNEFLSTQAEYISVDKVTSSTFLLSYKDSAGIYGKCVMGSVSGTTITIGTASTFSAVSPRYIESVVLDSTHFVLTYYESSSTRTVIGVISGTTISSYGTAQTLYSGAGSPVCRMSDTSFLAIYPTSDSGDYYLASKLCNVSGTTITLGAESVGYEIRVNPYIQLASIDSETAIVVDSFTTTTDDVARIGFLYAPDPPTITTQAVISINKTTATFNGNITATGGENATERGFVYKKGNTGDPTISDSKISSTGDFGTGAFTETPTGLSIGQDYRVAAFATNSAGTTIGTTVGFRTLAVSKVVSGTTGAMSATIESLDKETKYYVRAYATNSEGTAYGEETSFTTPGIFIPSIVSGG
jgi:hypothetical protein